MAQRNAKDIESLKATVAQLEAQEADRKARERHFALRQIRRYDTRCKVLVGTLILKLADRDETTRKWLRQKIDENVFRDQDRALFDLPPYQKSSPRK